MKDLSVSASLGQVRIGESSSVSKLSQPKKVHEDSDSDDDCGPPIPDHMKSTGHTSKQDESSEDEEDIGPPLPPDLNQIEGDSSKLDDGDKEESDDDSYNDDDDVSG